MARLVEADSACCQSDLGFDQREQSVHAGFVAGAAEFDGFLVGFDGVVEDFLQGVLAAKFEEKDGEAGLFGEADVSRSASAELRVVLAWPDGVAEPPQRSGSQEA